mgnify:CR=1 FL=1
MTTSTEQRKCYLMISKRDPNKLPPNVHYIRCDRPAHSETGAPTCAYHQRIEAKALVRRLEKRITYSRSESERQDLAQRHSVAMARLEELQSSK